MPRRAGADHLRMGQPRLAARSWPRSTLLGDKAYQGTYAGFRILDISEPDNPVPLARYQDCAVGQGDVVVWENILVRLWDSNNSNPARACDGQSVPAGPSGTGGFEGVHIFDVSNPSDPALLGSVDLTCGSHTASGFPDVDNKCSTRRPARSRRTI